MKIKKIFFSTCLSDLYGRDGYQSHIKVGDEYWYYFTENTEVYKVSHKNWNKLRISYIRSGCLFYIFPEFPDISEEFCPISCFMTSKFILAELDPIKDLEGLMSDIDTESGKIRYCFDDEHTIIKNWPNEKVIDIDDEEVYEKFGNSSDYLLIKMLEIT